MDVIAKLSAYTFLIEAQIPVHLGLVVRLTLIKSVLSSLPLYLQSSFKVPKGAIYGIRRALDKSSSYARRSPWLDIVNEVRKLASKGIDLLSLVKKKVGNGDVTSFWNNVWLGDFPLKQTYPRLYFLELDKHVNVASRRRANISYRTYFAVPPRSGIEEEQLLLLISNTSSVILSNISDRWSWLLDSSGDFSVKSTREFIDDSMLPKTDVPTIWVKSIHIKINVFAWRFAPPFLLPIARQLMIKDVHNCGNRVTRLSLIMGMTSKSLVSKTRVSKLLKDVFEVALFHSYSSNKSVNRYDIIDVVCEEYAPELLGFSNNDSSGGNPTPTSEPFTSEFILEEIEAYLKDDSISPQIDYADCDLEEDICLIENLLNNDPFQLPPIDLKQSEVTEAKSSIEEPSELELKDLPSHLEYAYLEKNDKLPVIIAKGLNDDEKVALLKVLKSHKRAIAWKITDIKVHCVPKKGGITVVANEENELIPTCLVTGWRVCIDYRKLNGATRKDHFLLPFMDQMLERLAGNEFYCFLDGFSGYFQIPIDPQDQEKTTFTCPYGTFAYRHMPFGLCNAPGTFQRCMMAIFHDMSEKTMEVFMDDFSVFGDSFDSCLSNLEKMLKRSMTHLLEKETPFIFSRDCIDTFQTLKKKLTKAPILVVPDWNLPFKIMCDASDFAIGAVLGQRKTKHFQPIHYA
ncbi:reverse transcriptase domain-containing protein, partial [Tanacetum coccineum]